MVFVLECSNIHVSILQHCLQSSLFHRMSPPFCLAAPTTFLTCIWYSHHPNDFQKTTQIYLGLMLITENYASLPANIVQVYSAVHHQDFLKIWNGTHEETV
jgi:hypothetical protein